MKSPEAICAMDAYLQGLMPGSTCRVHYPHSKVPELCLYGSELLDFMKWYLDDKSLTYVYSREGFWQIEVPAPNKEDLLVTLMENKLKAMKEDVSSLRMERISLLVDLEASNSRANFFKTCLKAVAFLVAIALIIFLAYPGGV